MKVLLVDDSGTMRAIQKKMLMGLGITNIVEAGDGQMAIKTATSEKPDLIMMDWNMPILSGIEALKKMKADPVLKSIPVIMVTSESEKSHIMEALNNGASNYVVKPFNADTIKEKLAPFTAK